MPAQSEGEASLLALYDYEAYIDYPGDHDTGYVLSTVEKTTSTQSARNVVSTVSGTSYNVCWATAWYDIRMSNYAFHRTGDYTSLNY